MIAILIDTDATCLFRPHVAPVGTPLSRPDRLRVASFSRVAKTALYKCGAAMRTMAAKDPKNSFGMLLGYAHAALVQVEKHGRPVVVVMSVEYLSAFE
ncbi:hypothetical protein [Mesorhizobium silamurunense]|uniref:hypothetical protein n=1 Tax=Mesorhizobium silamurunense TaxID=499528 RepID=UPI001AED9F10|nr:hypothetical protein [Mesorhizobium silamurunense]